MNIDLILYNFFRRKNQQTEWAMRDEFHPTSFFHGKLPSRNFLNFNLSLQSASLIVSLYDRLERTVSVPPAEE